jgi:4-nitrophenyl phosphatase
MVDDVTKVLGYLRSLKKDVIFVTNNASKSRKDYKKKFDKLGVQVEVDEIFGSAYAAAVYISSVLKISKDKKVYVIGEGGLEAELREEGISYLGGTDPKDNTLGDFNLSEFEPDPDVVAVVCGLDRSINYTKLSKAFNYLYTNPSCLFLATNVDSTYPVAGGRLPGSGALSATLRYSLKRDPTSIGKPNSTMLDCIKAKHNFNPKRTLMIGDRLDTDIEFGKNGGLSTLLVLTGVTSESDLRESSIVPDYVMESLGNLAVLAEQ